MALSDDTKLAVTFAEESSTRARRIALFIQIAAIVVLIAIWQELRFTWLNRRLIVAQKAEWVLACRPDLVYPNPPVQAPKPASPDPDESYRCANLPFAVAEKSKEAQLDELKKEVKGYLDEWGCSHEQVKTNVADLQHIIASRALTVGIPVLGLSFDVNDLSVVSGLSFIILLSWLKFSLSRMCDNVHQVFLRAAGHDPSELADAYDLLRMTQVLTLPDARQRLAATQTEKSRQPPTPGVPSRWKRITQITNLIVWTGAAAQLCALAEDLATSHYADVLNNPLTSLENVGAIFLTVYVLVRTWHCQKLINRNGSEWRDALNDVNAEAAVGATV